MNKIFTIYICTYNGEKVIEKCLEAILNLDRQRELVDKIVVVDNNSNDNTSRIVNQYIKKDNHIIYEFEPEQGLSNARRHAAYANTDWVIYVDDDNLLDSKWVVELEKIINNDSNLGVVNGAVIAVPAETLTENEQDCLNVIYRDLACTHIGSISVGNDNNKVPMGAGMCIRTKALKNILDDGWLRLLGRTGTRLSSGEDGELCELVFRQGYKYCFNVNMKLQHIIPKKRLQYDYINRLIYGLVEGRIELLKTHRYGDLECFLRKVKYKILNIIYLKNKYDNDKNTYWHIEVKRMIVDAYLKLL